MKTVVVLATLVVASISNLTAQTLVDRGWNVLTCIGGWDFNGSIASFANTLNARYNQQYNPYFFAGAGANPGNALFGTAYFSGSNGATFTSVRPLASSNAPSYNLLSTVGLTVANNSLGDMITNSRSVLLSTASALDNGRATFKVSTLTNDLGLWIFPISWGFVDVNLAFSARNAGTCDATISWSFSLDGENFTSIAGTSSVIPSSTGYNVFTADLSTITALNGVSALWLGLDYSESAAGAAVFLDNVAIYGTSAYVPEPSNYALLIGSAMAGFVLLRRRKTVSAA